MTIEFWPRSVLRPRTQPKRIPKKPKPRRPRLPIRVGKAQQMLSAAVILGDHELASWVDAAVKRSLVVGTPECLDALKKRLDRVMAPFLTRLRQTPRLPCPPRRHPLREPAASLRARFKSRSTVQGDYCS